MGNTSSQSSLTSLEQKCTDVIVSTAQKCATSIQMEQVVTISGNNNIIDGAKFKQAIRYELNCSLMAESMLDIQTKIANAIEQESKAEGQQFSASNVSSSNSTTIMNQVRENINIQTMNEIMTKVNMRQGLDLSGSGNVIRDWEMDQTGNLIQEASLKALNGIKSFTEVNNAVKQTADSKTKGMFDFLTDWLQNMPLVIGIVAVIFIYIMFGGGGQQIQDQMSQWVPPPVSQEYLNMFPGAQGQPNQSQGYMNQGYANQGYANQEYPQQFQNPQSPYIQ